MSLLGIDTVIASDVGPSTFNIFKRYGLKVYQAKGLVEDAVRHLKEDKLAEVTKPTVPRYSD